MPAKKSKSRRVPVKSAKKKERSTIQFDYIMSGNHRVILCDGITGGGSPGNKRINMSIFSERHPIPTSQIYEITPQGRLEGEPASKKRGAIVREVEATVSMNIEMARSMQEWLGSVLKNVDALEKKSKKKATKKTKAR